MISIANNFRAFRIQYRDMTTWHLSRFNMYLFYGFASVTGEYLFPPDLFYGCNVGILLYIIQFVLLETALSGLAQHKGREPT